MSEWQEVTLQDVVSKLGDGLHGTPEYDDTGDYYFINGNNLSNGKIILKENTRRTTKKEYEKYNKELNERTILVSINGTLGNIAFYNNEPCILGKSACYFHVIEEVDKYYIRYILTDKNFQEYIINFAHGTTIKNVSLKTMREYSFLLPSLPEQKAIASVLSSLDDKIDLLHRQNKTLEAMDETLFRQWFIEEAQTDWEEKKLGEYISIKHGFAFRGEFISTDKNNQILVTPGNFKIGGGFKVDKMKYYHNSEFPTGYVLETDDLVVTMTDLSKEGDTLGYPALIPESADEIYLHNQRIGKVVFKSNISKHFLYFLMKTDEYQWYVLGSSSGTSVRHTSPTSICDYSFLLPPSDKINQFNILAADSLKKVAKNLSQIRTLEKLRDTLLPKLMSGEVRVSY